MTQKALVLLLAVLGYVESARIRRVVGGQQMAMGAWPWLVSLNYGENHSYLELQGLDHLCGGTLIHPDWVLTAAHCVHYMSGSPSLGEPENWVAVLGEYNRRVEERSEQKLHVEGIYVYPNYSVSPNLTGDIALLKLRQPAQLTSSVRPLAIDSLRDIPDSSECKTAGWGQHSPDDPGEPQYGNGTMVPHVINVEKVTFRDCHRAYGHLWPLIDSSVICFYSPHRKDTCKGDSGGPLVCPGTDGEPVLSGIVSVGMGCALENYPGIYTRVGSYINWILATIALHTNHSVRMYPNYQRQHQQQQRQQQVEEASA